MGNGQADVTAMTSRSKLSAVVVIILVTALSVLVYLQSNFQVGRTIVADNFRPRKSHPDGVAMSKADHVLLRNGTSREMSEVAYRVAALSTVRPTEDFMTLRGEELRKRRKMVQTACKHRGYGGTSTKELASKISGNIIVDDDHQVVYCSVPKIACSSWKRVFLVLNRSFKTTSEISQYFANRGGEKMLMKLKDLPPSEIKRILSTYTKFMFVRHPFSRVLSAFRNKLDPESTFQRAHMWQQNIGNRILRRYREDSRPESHAYDLKFEEFVKYLADENVPYRQSSNKHWSRMYDQCLPCDIDYDVIGKFETLQEDTKYILRLIHADGVAFPGANSSSPTGSSNQTRLETYYKDVALVDLQGLYERFKIDFDLFGYDPPAFAFHGS